MVKSGAYIRDVHLLEQLNDQIKHSGEVMANIDQNVIAHISEVKNTLEEQLNYIQQRLDEAQARLSEAESACNACHATQVFVPELGVVPSCAMQEMAVDSARMEVEKWRTRYERGQQILGECQREIADYTSGGHTLIRTMYEQQTPKASQLLSDCSSKLQDILNSDVGVTLEGESAAKVGAIAVGAGALAAGSAISGKFSKFNMGGENLSDKGVSSVNEPVAVLRKNMDETTARNWEAVLKNNKDLEKKFGIKQGPRMSTSEADMQKANPHYGEKDEYGVNCATTANAYALRLRGFDVTAKGNPGLYRYLLSPVENRNGWLAQEDNVFKVWKNTDGSEVQPQYVNDWMKDNNVNIMTGDNYKKYIEDTCKEKGVYIMGLSWKGGDGHATILQRDNDGLHFVEPQVFESDKTKDGRRSLDDLLFHIHNGESGLSVNPRDYDGILRVDDKLFDPKYANLFYVNK